MDELVQLDALLERLRLKRNDLKRKINRFHSPIVRQLPPDVTSTIFEFCLPETKHPLSFYTEEDHSIPLSLEAICSYSREIAWSSPSLWSSLVVRVTSKHDSRITTGIVQEWLARSGQLPLSILVIPFDGRTASALAEIINQYSTRWSDLSLSMPRNGYQHFHATDNHAPRPKSIHFHCSAYATNLNFQLTCPRLERAFLSWFTMDGTDIQWDNLTHLTLHYMSISDSFIILRKIPRLMFCKVSGTWLSYRQQNLGALVLISLRSLQLLIATPDDRYLNHITARRLEEFSLPENYSQSMEVITSFFRRSACSLRSFATTFSYFPPHFERLMNFLQSMPSLNSLSILSKTALDENAIHVTPEDYDPRNLMQLVAKLLSSQSTSPQQGFLPNLKILEYTGVLHLRPGNFDDLYPLPPTDNAVHGPLHLVKLDLYPITLLPKKHDLLPFELGGARRHSECFIPIGRHSSIFY